MMRRAALPIRRSIKAPVEAIARQPICRAAALLESFEAARYVSPLLRSYKGYATRASNEPEKEIQLPFHLPGVPGKYASALYVAAARASALDKVASELKLVVEVANLSPTFTSFIKDQGVQKSIRINAIMDIFTEAKFSDPTKNLLALLAENGRLKLIYKVAEAFDKLMTKHNKLVKATITTALELLPEELEGLKDSLKGYIKPDETLIVEQKVDSGLVAGLIIDLEDKHIDLSVSRRIREIERVLREI